MGEFNRNTFGEKIGFSRADMASRVADFDLLCDTDKAELAKKAKLWKLPVAHEFVKQEGDPGLAYWKKLVRDYVRPAPAYRYGGDKNAAMKEYCENISLLRDAVMASKKIGYVTAGAGNTVSLSWWLANGPLQDSASSVFSSAGAMRWLTDQSETRIRFMAAAKKYGMTKEQAFRSDLERSTFVMPFCGQMEKPEDMKDFGVYRKPDGTAAIKIAHGTYYFYDNKQEVLSAKQGDYIAVCFFSHGFSGRRMLRVFGTKRDADSFLAEWIEAMCNMHAESEHPASRKGRFSVGPSVVTQTGGFERSPFHKTGDDFLSDFHFRGGEFGNWMSESDIQESMDASYVSFQNLAAVLMISPESVSFGGKMGIAFGSRGRGDAAAHYEPGTTDVINLTKMSGAGCLAHEWGHALDRHIADTLGMPTGSLATDGRTKELPKPLKEIVSSMGRGSRYFADSVRFGQIFAKQGNGYWYSSCEMFARAFDCYILDKLREQGITDTYLSGHAECFHAKLEDREIIAYPVGEERKQFERLFDGLIEWSREAGVLA